MERRSKALGDHFDFEIALAPARDSVNQDRDQSQHGCRNETYMEEEKVALALATIVYATIAGQDGLLVVHAADIAPVVIVVAAHG